MKCLEIVRLMLGMSSLYVTESFRFCGWLVLHISKEGWVSITGSTNGRRTSHWMSNYQLLETQQHLPCLRSIHRTFLTIDLLKKKMKNGLSLCQNVNLFVGFKKLFHCHNKLLPNLVFGYVWPAYHANLKLYWRLKASHPQQKMCLLFQGNILEVLHFGLIEKHVFSSMVIFGKISLRVISLLNMVSFTNIVMCFPYVEIAYATFVFKLFSCAKFIFISHV